ncbi:hypothetical protein WJX77_011762 [Trebouxia sp. C0004]
MSGRKLDAPLAVQMASLKKTMQNRDRRRNTDRAQKEREADDGAPATAQRRKAGSHLLSNATGGVRLGSCPVSGIAAGIAEPRVLRCVLCQATFKSVAEEQQHLAGPAHRKALLRQQTEQEHKTRLAKGRDAAHSAVEAAQWSSPAAQATSEGLSQPVNRQTTKVPPVAMTSAASGSLHHQKAGQSNLRQAKDQAAAAAKIPKQTHADLVAQMRQADEPLSVEGWVPPSLSRGASDATTHLPAAVAANRPAPSQAPNQDAVANSAHPNTKDTLPSDLGDQGFQQGLSGLQAYGSQSESDGSSSGCDRYGSGAVGPFF